MNGSPRRGGWHEGWVPARLPVGVKTQIRSRSASVVVMDQSAEQVPAVHIPRVDWHQGLGFSTPTPCDRPPVPSTQPAGSYQLQAAIAAVHTGAATIE